jgi:lysylphosphatidylglycerol synthetase-like protein (DUF2156 family)
MIGWSAWRNLAFNVHGPGDVYGLLFFPVPVASLYFEFIPLSFMLALIQYPVYALALAYPRKRIKILALLWLVAHIVLSALVVIAVARWAVDAQFSQTDINDKSAYSWGRKSRNQATWLDLIFCIGFFALMCWYVVVVCQAKPSPASDLRPAKPERVPTIHRIVWLAGLTGIVAALSWWTLPQFNRPPHTPLMLAAGNGSPEDLSKLITKGERINAVNVNGTTPLMYAVLAGRADNVRLLLQNGADFNVRRKNGDTALSLARQQGFTEIEKILQDAGARQ